MPATLYLAPHADASLGHALAQIKSKQAADPLAGVHECSASELEAAWDRLMADNARTEGA